MSSRPRRSSPATGFPCRGARWSRHGDRSPAGGAELGRCVVKAQAHAADGGRRVSSSSPTRRRKPSPRPRDARPDLQGLPHQAGCSVEEALDIAAEYYLAITVDRAPQVADHDLQREGRRRHRRGRRVHDPEPSRSLEIDAGLRPVGLRATRPRRAGRSGRQDAAIRGRHRQEAVRVFVSSDASLAEINPLVVTGEGTVIAADAKFDVDDNALFRQQELAGFREEAEEDPIEAEAHRRGRHLRAPGRRHRASSATAPGW